MALVRNSGRNISVSGTHSYTVEKVKKAMDFINSTNRFTAASEWVKVYNEIKGTNEKITGCHSCAIAKFTAGVRNYAKMGYLVLLNEGHKPQEFGIGVEEEVKEVLPVENEENRIVTGVEEEIIEEIEKIEAPKEEEEKEEETETEEKETETVQEEEEPKEEEAPKPKKRGKRN